jgi:hypothetical protein
VLSIREVCITWRLFFTLCVSHPLHWRDTGLCVHSVQSHWRFLLHLLLMISFASRCHCYSHSHSRLESTSGWSLCNTLPLTARLQKGARVIVPMSPSITRAKHPFFTRRFYSFKTGFECPRRMAHRMCELGRSASKSRVCNCVWRRATARCRGYGSLGVGRSTRR